MSRTIQNFKTFDDALADEKQTALARSAEECIALLHRLIKAWMKFPKFNFRDDDVPTLKE